MNKKRNYYLDFWKGLACFGVVYIHTYYAFHWGNRDVGDLIKSFFRFAMPIFFMTSGYYCYYSENEVTAKKLRGKIKHIFKINVVASIVWLMMQVMIGFFGDSHGGIQGMLAVMEQVFTPKRLIIWLVFNEDPFVKILWFVSALLYVYIMMVFINRLNIYRISYVFAIVLLVVHYILGNVLKGFGINIGSIYYRNFLLMGFPLFMFGHYIHQNEDVLKKKISANTCILLFALGELLVIPECYIFGKTELSIGAIIAAFSMLLLSLHKPERKKKSFISYIGADLSLFIYIGHIAVRLVLDRFAEHFLLPGSGMYKIYEIFRPFICFGICVVGGMIFNKILDRIKRKDEVRSA